MIKEEKDQEAVRGESERKMWEEVETHGQRTRRWPRIEGSGTTLCVAYTGHIIETQIQNTNRNSYSKDFIST